MSMVPPQEPVEAPLGLPGDCPTNPNGGSMPFYLVRCDLDDSEGTTATAAVDAALQELGDCVRPMPGTWIVEAATNSEMLKNALLQIGRAPCRERVLQYVYSWGVAV